ncbi:SGNH/GDSL hydrolase family protein [Dermatophilaceae bacterium Soc4.6]
MGRARRARNIAQVAAYGGGFGVAGIGAIGAIGYGVIKVEATLARRFIGQPFDGSPDDNGLYGAGSSPPIELLVLGDSTAAGQGADHPSQTVGALLANGVSAFSGRPVHLTNVAVVGAESSGLELQVINALDAVPRPDAAAILIGANDVTHRIDKSVAVRHLGDAVRRLREAGAEVVVGTCPDLGTLEPVGQPLRALVRRWSRDLAAAQIVAVVEAGGRTVSLGDLIGPEFASAPREMFSKDRFHPSPAGYARAASAMLPSVCVALGLWAEEPASGTDWRRGDTVGPVSLEATRAVREPGTEVSATEIGGRARGPRGRWAIGLHRPRRPIPTHAGDGVDAPAPATAGGSEARGPAASGG